MLNNSIWEEILFEYWVFPFGPLRFERATDGFDDRVARIRPRPLGPHFCQQLFEIGDVVRVL